MSTSNEPSVSLVQVHRRVNNQACTCGWSAKKAGHQGWMERAKALDAHVAAQPRTSICNICGASWTVFVKSCPVCTDANVIDAVQVLTSHGIDGRKYGKLLKLTAGAAVDGDR